MPVVHDDRRAYGSKYLQMLYLPINNLESLSELLFNDQGSRTSSSVFLKMPAYQRRWNWEQPA